MTWREGAHLEGTGLWFDAPRRHALSVLSHAQVRLRRGGKILCTSETAHLLGLTARDAPLVCEYGRPVSVGPLRIELLPSGYMLGGAQTLVETAAGRVLYAGDVSPAGSATATAAATRACEVLVLACRVGRSRPRGVPRKEALGRLIEAVEQALGQGATPVVLVETPGPAQDLLLELKRFVLRAHRAIVAHACAYAALGIQLDKPRGFRGRVGPGEVLLWPAARRTARALARLKEIRTLHLPARVDPEGLRAHIEAVAPRKIYLTGPFGLEWATDLRRHRIDAEPLGPPGQMSLRL